MINHSFSSMLNIYGKASHTPFQRRNKKNKKKNPLAVLCIHF